MSTAPNLDQELFTPDGEFEDEWEFEGEFGVSPGGASTSLLMEHLGSMAAQAESEAEAEAFLGALVPLAAKALSAAAPAITKATPSIISGISKVGRTLYRNPATRQMISAMPQVVKRTALDIARQHAAGKPLTTDMATRSLARQTAKVLGSPNRRRSAVNRCRAMDRRWHTKHGQTVTGARSSRRCPACAKAR